MENELRINTKAILFGLLMDFGSTIAISAVFGFIMGVVLLTKGTPENEIESRLTTSSTALVGGLIIGLGCTGLGGFVTARTAKAAELKHACILGAILTLFCLLSVLVFSAPPWWYHTTTLLLTIPVAMLGGYLATCRFPKYVFLAVVWLLVVLGLQKFCVPSSLRL